MVFAVTELKAYALLATLGETLAKKAIDSSRVIESRASKIKRRYFWRNTCKIKGKWAVRCTRLQDNSGIATVYKLVEKKVGTLGKISPR